MSSLEQRLSGTITMIPSRGTPNLADPRAARELFEKGYTVFECAYSEEEVAFLREHLVRQWDAVGRPELYANPPYSPAPNVTFGPAGLLFLNLPTQYPELAPRLYKRHIIDTMRTLLGNDMRLEVAVGTLSDRTRPFFDWHVHIGAVDEAYYNHNRPFPTFERSERVTHLLYLDGLSKENGPLLVLPRTITDPTTPPFDTKLTEWPGQVEITCPPGSVVLLEQCTWHAAHRKESAGLRAFVGSYFGASYAPPTPWTDKSLPTWEGEDELFRSILPHE